MHHIPSEFIPLEDWNSGVHMDSQGFNMIKVLPVRNLSTLFEGYRWYIILCDWLATFLPFFCWNAQNILVIFQSSCWYWKDDTGIWVLIHGSQRITSWTHRQQARKVFIKEKQIAPRTAGRGEKRPLSLPSYRGFYSLKMGVPTWGPEKCAFFPLALLNYLYQSLSNRTFRVGNVLVSFMVSLSFSSLRLSHHSSHSFLSVDVWARVSHFL